MSLRFSPPRTPMPGQAKTGWALLRAPGRAARFGSGSQRNDAMRRSNRGAIRKQNLPLQRLMSQDAFSEVAGLMRYDDVDALYAAVGEGNVSTQSVIEKVLSLVREVDEGDGPELMLPTKMRQMPRST